MILSDLLQLVEEAVRVVFGSQQRLWLIGIIIIVTIVSLGGRLRVMSPRQALRSLRTDLVYASFYILGIYSFFLFGPVHRTIEAGMRNWAPFLEMDILFRFHPLVQLVVAYIVVDGFAYAAHRFAHTSRWLWPMHSIHHSQKLLSPLTNYRFHFIDLIWLTSARAVASFFLGIYGLQQSLFLPLALIPPVLELLAHSGFSWSYGPLGRIFVSPRFHAIHHSSDEDHADRNFGFLFSFWDDLFGTSERRASAPIAYGIRDTIPDGFLRQQFYPFIGRRPAEDAETAQRLATDG